MKSIGFRELCRIASKAMQNNILPKLILSKYLFCAIVIECLMPKSSNGFEVNILPSCLTLMKEVGDDGPQPKRSRLAGAVSALSPTQRESLIGRFGMEYSNSMIPTLSMLAHKGDGEQDAVLAKKNSPV